MNAKLYYKAENDVEYKELASINKIDVTPETISFDKYVNTMKFAINANAEFKAALCFLLGEYNPFDKMRCRTCRLANLCNIEKINKRYRRRGKK